MQKSLAGSRAVLLSLALINGFFAVLHATVTGVVKHPGTKQAAMRKRDKKAARVDVVDAMVSMIDRLQTLVVFGLLIFASWASIVPAAQTKGGAKSSHGCRRGAQSSCRVASKMGSASVKRMTKRSNVFV